jgi:hypothetical protein
LREETDLKQGNINVTLFSDAGNSLLQ